MEGKAREVWMECAVRENIERGIVVVGGSGEFIYVWDRWEEVQGMCG